MTGIVIIGGGQAGYQIAASLRSEGYTGRLTLIGAEPGLPYQRPPLSKGLLLGHADPARLPFRLGAFYEKNRIDLRLGTVARGVECAAKKVLLDDGEITYERLALATGAHVRHLPVPGADAEGVLTLRTLDDALVLRDRIEAATHVVIIGGGFIGLEVAASARKSGKIVTVVELAPRLMGRVVAPPISAHFLALHERHGSEVLLETGVEAILEEGGRAAGVITSAGRTLRADLVVIGVGVTPADELARAAALEVKDGIVVDAAMRTSDPAIVAAGDCARHPNAFAGDAIRLESVQNAIDQGKVAARTLLDLDARYDAVPWFWSDQFEAKLQMVGISTGYDRVVTRGEPASGRFSVLYYRAEHLIAIDSVSEPADHMAGRRLLAAACEVPPDLAADPGRPLRSFL